MTVCFIDRDHRVTPAEREGWATFLAMPASCMKAAREAFRRVHGGDAPEHAFLSFVATTGLEDDALLARMEKALKGLAEEGAR
jgi:hypothetical protein